MINDDTCIPEFRVTSTETDDDKPVYGMGYCSYPILRSQSHYQYYPIYRKRLSGIHSLIYMKPPSKPCFGLCFFCWVHVREGIQCQGKDQMILKLHVLLFLTGFRMSCSVMVCHAYCVIFQDIHVWYCTFQSNRLNMFTTFLAGCYCSICLLVDIVYQSG